MCGLARQLWYQQEPGGPLERQGTAIFTDHARCDFHVSTGIETPQGGSG